MPLYEYRCKVCGHRFEALKSISARDEVVCEKCGAKVERVYQGKCAFGAPKAEIAPAARAAIIKTPDR